jgi:hypothetical protein
MVGFEPKQKPSFVLDELSKFDAQLDTSFSEFRNLS